MTGFDQILENIVAIKEQDLANSFIRLSEQKKAAMAIALIDREMNIDVVNLEGKAKTFNLTAITSNIVNSGNAEAMKVLLDAGISKRLEFYKARPIHSAILQGHEIMVAMLLENEDVRRNLVIEENNKQVSVLHVAAKGGNATIINSILKYPKGLNLLSMENAEGHTPREIANENNHPEAEHAIRNGELVLVKDELMIYFKEQMRMEDIINADRLHAMKKTVEEKLIPLALSQKEEREIKDVASSIVREVAKIIDTKLNWQQKSIEIKNMIKDILSEFFLLLRKDFCEYSEVRYSFFKRKNIR